MSKFNTNYQELAHHWVYNNDYSECYGNRMFSENKIIYSYGHHFKIAQKIDIRDNRIYLITSDSYSNTTAKQINCVRSAIPYNSTVFTVPGAELNHSINVEYYINLIEDYAVKESKARSVDYKHDIICSIETLKSYIDIFKYDRRKLTKLTKQLLDFDLNHNIQDLIELLTGIRNNKVRITAKKAKAINKKRLQVANEGLSKWLRFESDRVDYHTIGKIHLRYNNSNNIIETSNSVAIPLVDAMELHKKVKRADRLLGEKIANYKIVEAGKVFKIGCTELTRDVLNDMCKQLNLEEVF